MELKNPSSRDEILSALAWAIWQSDNAGKFSDEQNRQMLWKEAKKEAMSKAVNVFKRLQKRGVTLSLNEESSC